MMELRYDVEPDWRGDVLPDVTARRCPSCGRHVRTATIRLKHVGEPARLAYTMICPNRCAAHGGAQPALFELEAASPHAVLRAGVRRDVRRAIDEWNTLIGARTATIPTGGTWREEVACPVCRESHVPGETFDDGNGRRRIGCPKHSTVGSWPIRPDSTGWELEASWRDLKDWCAMWTTWRDNHHCMVCDTDATLTVNPDTGRWSCTCACDGNDVDERLHVLYSPQWNPATTADTVGKAIGAWRQRESMRVAARDHAEQARARNTALLDAVAREMEAGV